MDATKGEITGSIDTGV
ncbi:hypothetical protein, partial [Tropheryma whipplei]